MRCFRINECTRYTRRASRTGYARRTGRTRYARRTGRGDVKRKGANIAYLTIKIYHITKKPSRLLLDGFLYDIGIQTTYGFIRLLGRY